MGMQIALTNTRLCAGITTVLLAACDPAPIGPRAETVAERLALLEQECGFTVTLPSNRAELEALFAQHGAHTYVSEPSPGGSSGDNVFPMEDTPEMAHGEVVSAIVVICPAENPMALGSRSPRFAFYIDENGKAFHVEDHSLYLG
jgi:hypothetical protein